MVNSKSDGNYSLLEGNILTIFLNNWGLRYTWSPTQYLKCLQNQVIYITAGLSYQAPKQWQNYITGMVHVKNYQCSKYSSH